MTRRDLAVLLWNEINHILHEHHYEVEDRYSERMSRVTETTYVKENKEECLKAMEKVLTTCHRIHGFTDDDTI